MVADIVLRIKSILVNDDSDYPLKTSSPGWFEMVGMVAPMYVRESNQRKEGPSDVNISCRLISTDHALK